MMCSWQAQGPLFAMATERGECVVWHFPSRERVKVLPNCAMKVEELEKQRKNAEENNNKEVLENEEKTSNKSDSEDEDNYVFARPFYSSPMHQTVRIVKFNPVPLFNYSKSLLIILLL